MLEHLSPNSEDKMMSVLRRGTALPKPDRQVYVARVKAMLAQARSLRLSALSLADQCLEDMAQFDQALPEEWKAGVADEILWWWSWFSQAKEDGRLDTWVRKRDKPFPYENEFANCPNIADLRVLDIGCGPMPTTGQRADRKVSFVHLDPLATAYNQITRLVGLDGAGAITFGAVEFLDRLDIGKFHVVHACNCLDHAFDLLGGIDQIIGVLDTPGLISLSHYENEAEAQDYLGFHQWNIEVIDNKLRIWNRNRDFILDPKEHGFEMSVKREPRVKENGHTCTFLSVLLKRGL